MTIQECEVQERCHALLLEQGLLKPASKYVCGFRGAGTVKHCPKRDEFMIRKGENGE